jgi:hypothetical protein
MSAHRGSQTRYTAWMIKICEWFGCDSKPLGIHDNEIFTLKMEVAHSSETSKHIFSHGVETQKTTNWSATAVKTWKISALLMCLLTSLLTYLLNYWLTHFLNGVTNYSSNVTRTRITSLSLSAGRSVTVRLTGVLINSYGGKIPHYTMFCSVLRFSGR